MGDMQDLFNEDGQSNEGKYGYLTGASAAPALADSNYNKWIRFYLFLG
ncbi:hypothetical protein L3X38_000894 [Prunus dulcis]|uniref:Uncharacterized protein n=1 Tax=Prunus dulcis TaxID=3755 RepID=A0AAD4ZIG1_PRUDU|nr:hypothetical protein L3X38_000894 [Prunus dulcis]